MPLYFIKIIIALFAVSNFLPEYFAGMQPFAILLKLAYNGYLIGMFVEFIVDKKIEKKITLWVIIYYLCLMCSTVIYSGYNIPLLRSFVKNAAISIVVINFFAKYIRSQSNYFFKICAGIGEVGAILNFFSIIFFPAGLFITAKTGEPCWLYGHKNSLLIAIIIPLFASAVIYRNQKTGRISIRTFLFAFVILISAILSGASTVMICMILLILMMFILSSHKMRTYISMKKCIYGPFILGILVAFFRIQNLFSFFIVDILNKNLTLSTRTIIWEYALQYFKESPVLGVGYLFPGDLYKMILLSSTHNFIIGILFHMGVLGVIVWTIAFSAIIYKNKKSKCNQIMRICAVFLMIYLIQGITENIFAPCMEMKGFLFMIMCYYLPTE